MVKSGHPVLKPSRVLVADDEHLIASSICNSVRSLGYEAVGPVGDGSEALRAFDCENPPDIAILDIRMPGMDGLEAARVLWHEQGVPSIIVSAYSGEEHLARAQAAGVFGYLIKPVSADAIGAELRVAWSRYCDTAEYKRRIQQLETTLQDRRLIEQAKWQLVQKNALSEAEAHSAIQRLARNQRRKLREVAQSILDSDGSPVALD